MKLNILFPFLISFAVLSADAMLPTLMHEDLSPAQAAQLCDELQGVKPGDVENALAPLKTIPQAPPDVDAAIAAYQELLGQAQRREGAMVQVTVKTLLTNHRWLKGLASVQVGDCIQYYRVPEEDEEA